MRQPTRLGSPGEPHPHAAVTAPPPRRPQQPARPPSRSLRLVVSGATAFALTGTVAVVWPISMPGSPRRAVGAASTPGPRTPAVGIERQIEATLRRAEPAWFTDGILVSAHRVDVRLCQPSGVCASLELADPGEACATPAKGGFCLTWAGRRPQKADLVENAFVAQPVVAPWTAAPAGEGERPAAQRAASAVAERREGAANADPAVLRQASSGWAGIVGDGEAPIALRLAMAAAVSLIATAVLARRWSAR